MTFALRPYEEADWPEALALWIEAWTFSRPGMNFSARAPWLKALFARSLAEGARLVVAEDSSGLLGFVLFDPARKWLDQIAVRPGAFGSGVARALLAHAKSLCPEGLGLDVNADNFRALGFYASEGFLRTGEANNPLSGLPTLVLSWTPEPC